MIVMNLTFNKKLQVVVDSHRASILGFLVENNEKHFAQRIFDEFFLTEESIHKESARKRTRAKMDHVRYEKEGPITRSLGSDNSSVSWPWLSYVCVCERLCGCKIYRTK